MNDQPVKPISEAWMMRILLLIILLLAISSGYYHTKLTQLNKVHQRLDDKYVRVRSELGVEEVNRLLEASYD